MNIAFIQFASGGTARTRAEITALGRAEFEGQLEAEETLESFLYASPPGTPWPCGPDPESWATLCEAIEVSPQIKPGIEMALAASRHRYLAML